MMMDSQFFEEQNIKDLLDDLQESAYSSSDDLTLDTYCDTNDKPFNLGYNEQFDTQPESCEIGETTENSSTLLTDASCNSWEIRIKTTEEPNSIDIDGLILEAIPSKSFSESATIVDNKNSHVCRSLKSSMDISPSDTPDTMEISKVKDTISKLDQNLRANIMMAFYHLSQTVQTSGIETPLELKNVVGVKEQELLYMMYSHNEEKKTPVAAQATSVFQTHITNEQHPAPAQAARTKKRIHEDSKSTNHIKPTQPTKTPTRRKLGKQ